MGIITFYEKEALSEINMSSILSELSLGVYIIVARLARMAAYSSFAYTWA